MGLLVTITLLEWPMSHGSILFHLCPTLNYFEACPRHQSFSFGFLFSACMDFHTRPMKETMLCTVSAFVSRPEGLRLWPHGCVCVLQGQCLQAASISSRIKTRLFIGDQWDPVPCFGIWVGWGCSRTHLWGTGRCFGRRLPTLEDHL